MYKHLSDKMLFEYFMIHSTRTRDVFCPKPFFIDGEYIDLFKSTSEKIDSIVHRIIEGINSEFKDFKSFIPEFPYKDEILNLDRPLAPVFWTRYDGFVREDGKGIFYSELNYDKPCAQRECLAMEELYRGSENSNNGFRRSFINNYYNICRDFNPNKKVIKTAVLTDPCHYEETHLAMLFKDLLTDNEHSIILVGPKNLYIEADTLYAFGEEIDILLKLFPTEYSSEINNFPEILELFNKNKVLLLNDPRVIVGQCKNLYTYLWELIESGDSRLSDSEASVIRNTLPKTVRLTKENLQLAINNKDKYVIKPVYGRYSIDVFIGKIHTEEEWKESIEYILEKMEEKEFILQDFCGINLDTAPYYNGNFIIPCQAYANLGIYLSLDKYIGLCSRWNESYLTSDESTWITPIVKTTKALSIKNTNLDFDEILREAVIDCSFSGAYVKNYRYLGTDHILIEREKLKELEEILSGLIKIFMRTQNYLLENIDLYADILGIENQRELLKTVKTGEFSFIGRIDCMLDTENQWKVLEINAETPAGLCESIKLDELIFNKLKDSGLERINNGLKGSICKQAEKILKDYKAFGSIKNLAIVGSLYYEDWYTTLTLYQILKNSFKDINIIHGSIYDLKVKDENVFLYNQKVDCIFRYYPLDWFDYEETEDLKKIKELLKGDFLSLNPLTTIIPQSKAFFAVIYELIKHGFYDALERDLILKHIPFTTFDLEELKNPNFLVKPLLGREGDGIELSYNLGAVPEEDCIFQDMVYSQTLKTRIHTEKDSFEENLYPVIGAYITGSEFSGIYTRLGSVITNNICRFLPIYIKKA